MGTYIDANCEIKISSNYILTLFNFFSLLLLSKVEQTLARDYIFFNPNYNDTNDEDYNAAAGNEIHFNHSECT